MTPRLAATGLLLFVLFNLPAHAAEPQPPSSAYREIMRAQYAARQQPRPVRAEEAQRIYDVYLKSIGQQVRDRPTDTGGNAGIPPR